MTPLTSDELINLGFVEHKSPYIKNWGTAPETAEYVCWIKGPVELVIHDGFATYKGKAVDTLEELIKIMQFE